VVGYAVAFMLTGWPPVPALANVMDGSTSAGYRMVPGEAFARQAAPR
jgi:hypothetical protein